MGHRRRKREKTNLLLGEGLALHELRNLLVEAAMGGGRRHLVHAHPLRPALSGSKSSEKTTGKRRIEATNATQGRRDGRFDGSGRRIGRGGGEGGRRRRGKPSRPWLLRAMAASLSIFLIYSVFVFFRYSNFGNWVDFIFSFFFNIRWMSAVSTTLHLII